MARKLRVEFPGAIYHVTVRGVGRCRIFSDDRDQGRFLNRLASYSEEHDVRIYMYCLMTNHVHLLLETPKSNLGKFMHRLQTAYTVYFNMRHNRSGHLFQGRYGAVLVEGDEYLLNMSRYLHLNPVCIKAMRSLPLKERVTALRNYTWSSYSSYIGRAKKLDWIDYGPILAMMRGSEKERRQEYRKFVETGLSESDEEFDELRKNATLSFGSQEFMEKIRDIHNDLFNKHKRKEDVLFRKTYEVVEKEIVMEAVCREFRCERAELKIQRKLFMARPVVAKMLSKYAGLNQRKIAEELGIGTGAAVSIQLRKMNESLKESRSLRRHITAIEDALEKERRC